MQQPDTTPEDNIDIPAMTPEIEYTLDAIGELGAGDVAEWRKMYASICDPSNPVQQKRSMHQRQHTFLATLQGSLPLHQIEVPKKAPTSSSIPFPSQPEIFSNLNLSVDDSAA